MSNLELFDHLRRRLSRAGLPRPRIDRLLVELDDHYCESVAAAIARGLSPQEAQSQSISSLGTVEEIAQTVMRSAVRETWMGRHRVTSFIVAPIVLYPFAVFLIAAPLSLSGVWLVGYSGLAHVAGTAQLLKWIAQLVIRLLAPLAILIGLHVMGQRHFYGRRFLTTAGAIVILWSIVLDSQMTLPVIPLGPWQISVGVIWRMSDFMDRYRGGLFLIYFSLLGRWLQRRRELNHLAAQMA